MKLLATSVVRGSEQGESHGGVYLLDLEPQVAELKLAWDTAGIDWAGRGGDRGLRGIAFDGEIVYITASDELFAFAPDFSLIGSWRNPYLKHCHETSIRERTLYIASTGFDSILGFDLDEKTFNWECTSTCSASGSWLGGTTRRAKTDRCSSTSCTSTTSTATPAVCT